MQFWQSPKMYSHLTNYNRTKILKLPVVLIIGLGQCVNGPEWTRVSDPYVIHGLFVHCLLVCSLVALSPSCVQSTSITALVSIHCASPVADPHPLSKLPTGPNRSTPDSSVLVVLVLDAFVTNFVDIFVLVIPTNNQWTSQPDDPKD